MSKREARYNKAQEEDEEVHLILKLDNGKTIEVKQNKDNKINNKGRKKIMHGYPAKLNYVAVS